MNPLPSLFISHGAPPFALNPGRAGALLRQTARALPRPQALLLVSPHWMTPGLRVGHAAAPETIHDFGGFAPALYQLRYPAPGHPAFAARSLQLLRQAGWRAQAEAARGLDHGAWVPLRHLYPDADVPVFQVSMPADLDAAGALALGRALAPLRHEGVLLIGSGSLTHNLYEFFSGRTEDAGYAAAFVRWVRAAVQRADHAALAETLSRAPQAARAHPTTEHFLPLLFALGAAWGEAPATVLDGGWDSPVLSMESYVFGARLSLADTAPVAVAEPLT